MKKLQNRGFTIIELLIATVVFAVVLLMLTTAIVQFGRIYYRGNVTSKTQEAARNVMNSIAQDIQFGSSTGQTPDPDNAVHNLAVGNSCYTYQLNKQVTASQHGLMMSQGICPVVPAWPSNGRELLGENMQLVDLTVSPPVNDLYTVRVRVVYGENDDFTDGTKKSCKAIIRGGQFCAIAELSTTVAKRIK